MRLWDRSSQILKSLESEAGKFSSRFCEPGFEMESQMMKALFRKI